MSFALTVALLAVITAIACSMPGVVVVANKDAMLLDGMGHAVLPGIVIGALLAGSIHSPWLIFGAGAAAFFVALATRWLASTGLIAEGGALGLVFPTMFALGIVLLSVNLANVHLDVHIVLVGDLNLAAMQQPSYFYTMVPLALLNLIAIAWLLPLFGACAFDERSAQVSGVKVKTLRVVLLALTSLTVTASFHAAGVMLVIAMMVLPAATARILVGLPFLARSGLLRQITVLSLACAAIGSLAGFRFAYQLNIPTSVGITLVYALIFGLSTFIAHLHRRHGRRALSMSSPSPHSPRSLRQATPL